MPRIHQENVNNMVYNDEQLSQLLTMDIWRVSLKKTIALSVLGATRKLCSILLFMKCWQHRNNLLGFILIGSEWTYTAINIKHSIQVVKSWCSTKQIPRGPQSWWKFQATLPELRPFKASQNRKSSKLLILLLIIKP